MADTAPAFDRLTPPTEGQRITAQDGKLSVPDDPIIPYIRGDGTGIDIWPAAQVGYKTALFAGDGRSLRLREDDPNRAQYGQPDAIVTHLEQIPGLIETISP